MKRILFFISIIFLILPACDKSDGIEEIKITMRPGLIFHSGFEPNTAIVVKDSKDFDFVGKDLSVSFPNSWGSDGLESGNFIISSRINCGPQNVSDTVRIAEIVNDPLNPSNRVLKFWGKYPNEGDGLKFRIQTDLHSTRGIEVVHLNKWCIPLNK